MRETSIKRIHPYVESDDLETARDFYTDVLGLEVAMEDPVLGLKAPDLPSAQVIVCPRGFENPQPDFGIDLDEPGLVDRVHARVRERDLRVVSRSPTNRGESAGSSSRIRTVASSTSSRTFPEKTEAGRRGCYPRFVMEPKPTVWPVLHYDDTSGALRFLVEAFGFVEALAVPDESGEVVHAELRWPEGGAVVFGSTAHTGGVHEAMRPGTSASYVVTDDVDGIHGRALESGAEIIEPPHETEFGSGVKTRAFTAKDPEGNLWTFGNYRGAG